jgi:diadenylate cyclase
VRLDAQVSRDLLLSIFKPGTALHDGAVIIQKDRLAAAACFLPLSVRPEISGRLGTRHRAGLGITEESDALAIMVSEETGAISVASGGELESGVTIERAEERIRRHFGAKGVSKRALPPKGGSAGMLRHGQAHAQAHHEADPEQAGQRTDTEKVAQ